MQVEVSKYTEGAKEKARRPNGLPSSLIRYDARQKDRATETVSELVRAFKKPPPTPALQAIAGDASFVSPLPPQFGPPSVFKAGQQARRRSSEPRPDSQAQKLSGVSEHGDAVVAAAERSKRTSGFLSLLGIGKSQRMRQSETMTEFDLDVSVVENDRPQSRDDFDRTLGIRRGIDLATTLERIEKNFVISDPRLPDNPIVRNQSYSMTTGPSSQDV